MFLIPSSDNSKTWVFINKKQPLEVFYKKDVLKISQNSQENTCARVSFLIKLQALAQVFSCQFCEISKNNFFREHLWTTASDKRLLLLWDFNHHVIVYFEANVLKEVLFYALFPQQHYNIKGTLMQIWKSPYMF